jgi:hypothetical protein
MVPRGTVAIIREAISGPLNPVIPQNIEIVILVPYNSDAHLFPS